MGFPYPVSPHDSGLLGKSVHAGKEKFILFVTTPFFKVFAPFCVTDYALEIN